MNPTYYLPNGAADYETNRTRELKKASWVAWPNDMNTALWAELAEMGPEFISGLLAIVLEASRSAVRWHLIDELGRPHTPKSLARASRLPELLFVELFPKLVNLGVLAVTESQASATKPQDGAGLPHQGAVLSQPSAGLPHLSATCPQTAETSATYPIPQDGAGLPQEGAPRALARRNVTVRNGTNGQNGQNGHRGARKFLPELAAFTDGYPAEVNQLASQYFVELVNTPALFETFKAVIEARKNSKAWRDGYFKSAENYMKSGDWCTMPKIAAVDPGPRYTELEN